MAKSHPYSIRRTHSMSRRSFVGATAAGIAATVSNTRIMAAESDRIAAQVAGAPESTAKRLFESLSAAQRSEICFDWNHQDPKRGLLRTRVANNWHITNPQIVSDFYTKEQQGLIREVFEGIIQPDWHKKFYKQLEDDAGGFGREQNIAIFGTPGSDKFEFVMTGRHMTIRCDGNSTENVAFGGPIFYGHAASGDEEGRDHEGNVFWEQAKAANSVYQMLDGKQRAAAEVPMSPREESVAFRGKQGAFQGIPIRELSLDQKEAVRKVLGKLIEPYRQSDQDEVIACLQSQGGLDRCSLAFFTDHDIGNDRVWDNWRIEGPSFVWHFRGSPHVHVWVNVADNPSVALNA